MFQEKEKWPSTNEHLEKKDGILQIRNIQSARDNIDTPYGVKEPLVCQSGCMNIGENTCPAKLYWWLLPKDPPKNYCGSGPYAIGKGYIGAIFQDEMYERYPNAKGGGHHRYKYFGISIPKLASRLFIILEPKKWNEETKNGSYPTATRTKLMYKSTEFGQSELPWDEWAEEFKNNTPDEIKHEIEEYINSSESNEFEFSNEIKNRIASMLSGSLKANRVIQHPTGDVFGLEGPSKYGAPDGDGKSPSGGGRKLINVKPNGRPSVVPSTKGNKKGKVNNVEVNIPDPVYRSEDFFEDDSISCHYDEDHFQVWISQSHPIIKANIEYCLSVCKCSEHDAKQMTKTVICEHIASRVAHVLTMLPILTRNGQTTEDAKKLYLSDEALTTSLMGLMAESFRYNRMGSSFGKNKSKEKLTA